MISIVCIEIENEGNIGAIARSMKNFGLKNLVLINPKCNHLSGTALERSTHAKEILRKAKVGNSKLLDKFDYLVGTTALMGTSYNIPRSPLTPKEFGEKLKKIKKKKIALILGREGNGLYNEEIQICDFIVTIPSSRKYGTMNISHAAAILFYEIFQAIGKDKLTEGIVYASKKEKDQIIKLLDNKLEDMGFSTEMKKETQRRVWKRIIGKALVTKREAFALMGFLKKIQKK